MKTYSETENLKIIKVADNQIVSYFGEITRMNKNGFAIAKKVQVDPQVPEVMDNYTQTLRICEMHIKSTEARFF